MQPFGLMSALAQADIFSRGIALILLIMSVLSWSIVLVKTIYFYQLNRMRVKTIPALWAADNYEQAIISFSKEARNPFAQLAYTGHCANIHSVTYKPHLHQQFDMNEWLTRAMNSTIDGQISRLKSGMAALASIGSTAPFIGLLGTVWGIYHALHTIGLTGEASIGQVAGPVGEALIMTAFGLFVAIPAVLSFNLLTRHSHLLVHSLGIFANDLYALFMTGERLDTSVRHEKNPAIALMSRSRVTRNGGR